MLIGGGGSLVAKSCHTLATPWTAACQAPLSMGFSMARILEWVAISFTRGSSQPRDQTFCLLYWQADFYSWATRKAFCGCLPVTNPLHSHSQPNLRSWLLHEARPLDTSHLIYILPQMKSWTITIRISPEVHAKNKSQRPQPSSLHLKLRFLHPLNWGNKWLGNPFSPISALPAGQANNTLSLSSKAVGRRAECPTDFEVRRSGNSLSLGCLDPGLSSLAVQF